MPGELFYPPPQPTQGRIGVPIPAQGDQPPFGPRQHRVCADIIRLSWEPPDPPPQRDLKRSTPFTYGDMPPKYNPAGLFQLVDSWRPPDPQPWQRPLTVAPLTLTYGQQPPNQSGMTDPDILNLALSIAWQPPDPLPQIPSRRYVAPLTLTYGDTPPKFNPAGLFQLIDAWRPPDPWPKQLPLTVAPLTLVYGDQPPNKFSTAKLFGIVETWIPPDPQPWQRPPFVPIPVQGDTPPKTNPAQLFQLVDAWRPPDPTPWQHPLAVAPLLLTYGETPPRYSTANFRAIMGQWQPPDPMPNQRAITAPIPAQGDSPPFQQRTAPPANWLTDPWPQQAPVRFPIAPVVVISAYVPPPPYPFAVIKSWQVDPAPTQKANVVAPLTLTYGQQPPRTNLGQFYQLLDSWRTPDPQVFQMVLSVSASTTIPPIADNVYLRMTNETRVELDMTNETRVTLVMTDGSRIALTFDPEP